MTTKTKADEFDLFMEGLQKAIDAYKGHDFKGHFHNYPEWFLGYVVSEMRMSLFCRFLDVTRDMFKEGGFNEQMSNPEKLKAMVKRFCETGLKERIEGVCTWVECYECGQRVKMDLVDGMKLEVTSEACPYPDGHPEIVTYLDVPSGEILLFNDFRRIYSEDRKINFNINTTDGCRQYSEYYAEKGLIMHFVGNTCPSVYRVGDKKLIVGSFYEEEEGESLIDLDQVPGEELGSICTDLWWYCAVDKDDFEKKAGKTVEQYQKEYHDKGAWPEIIRAKVKPGRYRTTGRYHMVEDGVSGIYSEITYYDTLQFAEEVLGLKLHPYQKEMLRKMDKDSQKYSRPPRRMRSIPHQEEKDA